jgi:Mrp family chromosome partitioning ATPase
VAGFAALIVALITLPPPPPTDRTTASEGSVNQYRATTTLLRTTTSAATVPLTTLPIFVSTGDVPEAAAKQLGYGGDPNLLGQLVDVAIDDQMGTIGVTATDENPERATAMADAFSTALIDFLRRRAQTDIDRKIDLLQGVLERFRAKRDSISGSDALSEAQRTALDNAYSAVQQEITSLQVASATAGFDLEVLQPATAVPVLGKSNGVTSSGSSNRWLRLGLLLGTGLLLGAGVVLAIERFDTRLRGRKAVEAALRLPVVASVPALPYRGRRRREVLSASQPQGGVAEAYRSMRSALLLLPSRPVPPDEVLSNPPAPPTEKDAMDGIHDPKVVLFVSPGAGEGKTTSVVNLAAALAEAGRNVIVLDCDFRHPEAHEYLDVMPGKGLSDLLAAERNVPLTAILQSTAISGVRIAVAGTSTQHPGALMGLMAGYVQQARGLADVVLIDTPPVLLANDAIDLMPLVDSVVVVVREGRTGATQAQRVSAQLARLGTPCLGAALVAAHDAGAAYFDRGEATRRRLSRRDSVHTPTPTRARGGRHGKGGKW